MLMTAWTSQCCHLVLYLSLIQTMHIRRTTMNSTGTNSALALMNPTVHINTTVREAAIHKGACDMNGTDQTKVNITWVKTR